MPISKAAKHPSSSIMAAGNAELAGRRKRAAPSPRLRDVGRRKKTTATVVPRLHRPYIPSFPSHSTFDSRRSVQYPNISSKFRDSRTGKTIQYAGHDATSPYVNINARSNLRTPFESNIVATVDALEATLDYAFMKMGLSGESSVDHPIVMTEPVANLNHSRRGTLLS